MDKLKTIRGQGNRLLIGVTGGIASGKTTVSNMLEELGALLIDHDKLARTVVEPGKLAYKEIVDYFGSRILQEDRCIDRKKLSTIVFQNVEKRKRLESATHPRIHDLFLKELTQLAKKQPEAIIQVSIPLMIEHDLQYMFHKLVLAYIPEDKQVERLMARDNISEEKVRIILNAQMPINEKIGYADFVIHNSGSLEHTKKQVKELWRKLQKLQKEKAGNK